MVVNKGSKNISKNTLPGSIAAAVVVGIVVSERNININSPGDLNAVLKTHLSIWWLVA